MIPSVLPRSSSPVNSPRFHSPRRRLASAAPVRRATPYSSARVCSAAAIVLPVGALTTVIPARVAASRSTWSPPPRPRPMTTSRPPAEMSSASTWTWLRTISASYSGRIAASSSRVQPIRSSTSCFAARRSMPSRATLSAMRTLTRSSRRRGTSRRRARDRHADDAARRECGALGSGDGGARLDRAAELDRHPFEQRDRPVDLLDRLLPEMAEPEDAPLDLALAARQDESAILERAVERLPVEAVGYAGGGHRPRVVALVREQLEAERGEAGARRSRACLMAREDRLGALPLHQAQALVDLEDDRDRRRERRLAVD